MTDEEIANEIKRTELAIKRAELQLKESEQKKSGGFSITTSLPLLIAIIGLVASAVTAFIQRDTSLKLEESRFRSSLLLKALEAKDTDNISKMLLFMVNTKMLKDEDGSIRRIADKPEQLPILLEAVPGIKYGT
ncbi:MAG: hypothetical protein H7Z21_12195, partial [Hymenobacter sp.]|nr:hypothetical protein [Hymenobacter sp.]